MIKLFRQRSGRKHKRVHLHGVTAEVRLRQTLRGKRNIAREIGQTRQHKRATLGLPARVGRHINHLTALQHGHIHKRAHVLQLALHFYVQLRKMFPRPRHGGTVMKNFQAGNFLHTCMRVVGAVDHIKQSLGRSGQLRKRSAARGWQ